MHFSINQDRLFNTTEFKTTATYNLNRILFPSTGQLTYYSNTWFISTLHKSICAAKSGAILVLKLKESLWFLLHERSPPHNVQSFHNIIMAPLKDEKNFSTYQIFQNYQLGSMYTHISLCLRQKFCIGAADAHCWWNKEHYFCVSIDTSREPCYMCWKKLSQHISCWDTHIVRLSKARHHLHPGTASASPSCTLQSRIYRWAFPSSPWYRKNRKRCELH